MSVAPDHLSTTLNALADPTRRAILARLSQGETTVNELAEPFDMSLPAVSKHLKVLEKAGLISRGREKQWRPCRLEPEPLREVDMWLAKYRAMWEARLDRLEAYLHQLQAVADQPAPSAPAPNKASDKDKADDKDREDRT